MQLVSYVKWLSKSLLRHRLSWIYLQKNPLHRLHQHLRQLFTNYIRIKPIDVFFHFQIKFKLKFNSTKPQNPDYFFLKRPATNGISRNSPNSLESMARNQVYSSLIYSWEHIERRQRTNRARQSEREGEWMNEHMLAIAAAASISIRENICFNTKLSFQKREHFLHVITNTCMHVHMYVCNNCNIPYVLREMTVWLYMHLSSVYVCTLDVILTNI